MRMTLTSRGIGSGSSDTVLGVAQRLRRRLDADLAELQGALEGLPGDRVGEHLERVEDQVAAVGAVQRAGLDQREVGERARPSSASARRGRRGWRTTGCSRRRRARRWRRSSRRRRSPRSGAAPGAAKEAGDGGASGAARTAGRALAAGRAVTGIAAGTTRAAGSKALAATGGVACASFAPWPIGARATGLLLAALQEVPEVLGRCSPARRRDRRRRRAGPCTWPARRRSRPPRPAPSPRR